MSSIARVRWLAVVTPLVIWLSSCGGGSGNTMPAPSGLSYPSPPAFTANLAIAALNPTVTGTVSSYRVTPALPAGLSINAAAGVISGTPTAVTAKASSDVGVPPYTGAVSGSEVIFPSGNLVLAESTAAP